MEMNSTFESFLVHFGAIKSLDILYVIYGFLVMHIIYTPWKINMEPENPLFEKEYIFSFFKPSIFQVLC